MGTTGAFSAHVPAVVCVCGGGGDVSSEKRKKKKNAGEEESDVCSSRAYFGHTFHPVKITRRCMGRTANKGQNLLVLLLRLRLLHKVNLVLEDDYVLQLHNLNGSKVLRGLRLRA
jgi:hypothetical protein